MLSFTYFFGKSNEEDFFNSIGTFPTVESGQDLPYELLNPVQTILGYTAPLNHAPPTAGT
jgi:hypothetical protein